MRRGGVVQDSKKCKEDQESKMWEGWGEGRRDGRKGES